jgi:hypothetical protein
MLIKRWGVKLKRKTNKNIRQKNKTNKKNKKNENQIENKKQIKWHIYILARVREKKKSTRIQSPSIFQPFLKNKLR